MELKNLDANMVITTSFGREDVTLFDPREAPFSLHGVFYEAGRYRRLPLEVAKAVSVGVTSLCDHTAGGRLCFKTDSDFIGVAMRRDGLWRLPHMGLVAAAGFDLYLREDGKERFYGSFLPDPNNKDGYESFLTFSTRKMRELVIHFPLYCNVTELFIGLVNGAKVDKWSGYRHKTPVVFYGSSITQGACAATPGTDYIGRLSRRFDFDYVNLGFSGNAKGEETMMRYIASLDMSMFVYDYDHNAPTPEHLKATHYRGYETVRKAHPDIPIIMATRPNFDGNPADAAARRDIIASTYERAKAAGDENVYFLDSKVAYGSFVYDCMTVDRCHPTELGFYRMAEAFGNIMEPIFREWNKN